MNPKRAIVVLLAILCVGTASAEDLPPYEAFPDALGVAVGRISGTGLHYHHWEGPVGYQLTGGILYLPPTGSGGVNPSPSIWGGYILLDYNVGGAFQRRVYGDEFNDWFTGSLYLFAGGNHRGYIPMVESTPARTVDEIYYPPEYSPGAFQVEVSAGFGIGIELILFRHISLPVEFGYGGSWTITEPDLAQAFAVQLYGQTALRYRY